MIKKIFNNEAARFIAVGIVNTLFGSIIMFVLYNAFNCSYWLSSACNYFFGSILSFFLNKYFTFRNDEKSLKQVARFIVNILICYFLAYSIAKPLAFSLISGLNTKIAENLAMFIGMIFFTALNFVGQKFFAFKNKQGEKRS